MSVRIEGIHELLNDLEQRLGQKRMQQVSDTALKAGADVFVKELIYQIESAGDKGYAKGYTVDEVTVTEPFDEGGVRTIKVHWRGPHNRYRLIHLNRSEERRVGQW